MSPAPALSPCAACSHAEDHHAGCRVHEGCCGADACGCMGFEPAMYRAADADAWGIVLRWDDRPATRAEIEIVAAWMGLEADVLEKEVRAEEQRARDTLSQACG